MTQEEYQDRIMTSVFKITDDNNKTLAIGNISFISSTLVNLSGPLNYLVFDKKIHIERIQPEDIKKEEYKFREFSNGKLIHVKPDDITKEGEEWKK